MPVLVDFSNIFKPAAHQLNTPAAKKTIGEMQPKHIISACMSSLLKIKKKFSEQYGEIIICTDNTGHYWRRDFFPYYKAKRKEYRKADGIDWKMVDETSRILLQDIEDYLDYRVVDVDGAEADDCIAVLTQFFHHKSDDEDFWGNKVCPGILIVSADHDFKQLQAFPGVKQWSPRTEEFVRVDDPKQYLLEHIIKGDSGDGIPSIRSEDDQLVMGVRQKPVTKKFLEEMMSMTQEELRNDEEFGDKYRRNEKLVDLVNKVPKPYMKAIVLDYMKKPEKIGTPIDFIRKHKLNTFLDEIDKL